MMIYEAKEEENKIKLTVMENSTLKTDKGTYYNTQNGITFKDKNTKGKTIVSVLNLESVTLSNENILENGNDDITFNFGNGDVNLSVTADSDDFSDFNFVLVNDLQLLKNFICATCFELGYYWIIHQEVINECLTNDDTTNTNNTDNTNTDNTNTNNTTNTDNTNTDNTNTDNTNTNNTNTDNTNTDNTNTDNTNTDNTNTNDTTNTEPTEPTEPTTP